MNRKKSNNEKTYCFHSLLTTTSVSFLSGKNNDLLFVITDIDTFLTNKNCYKAVTRPKQGCFNCVSAFLKNAGPSL